MSGPQWSLIFSLSVSAFIHFFVPQIPCSVIFSELTISHSSQLNPPFRLNILKEILGLNRLIRHCFHIWVSKRSSPSLRFEGQTLRSHVPGLLGLAGTEKLGAAEGGPKSDCDRPERAMDAQRDCGQWQAAQGLHRYAQATRKRGPKVQDFGYKARRYHSNWAMPSCNHWEPRSS